MKSPVLLLAICAAFTVGACTDSHFREERPTGWELAFRKTDRNKDGKVSRQELGYTRIEEAFVMFDENQDGYVTLKEFVTSGGTPESFKKLDKNGNGKITVEEAKSAKIAMDSMTIAFYAADADKDGYVTLGEALEYRKKAREYTR